MTADPGRPPNQPLRRARIRPEYLRDYPATCHGQWHRVIEGHDPDVPLPAGHIRVEMGGEVKSLPTAHFEVAERTKRRILVVDDDPDIRRTLQIGLTNAGYEVVQARDGVEGTRYWHETGPDLIIADIHMPRKSGLLMIEDLREHGSSTPIIAMTDGGPAANLNLLGLAKFLGSVRTMPKPYSLEEMVRAVKEELDG